MATKTGVWRACLSDLLLSAGIILLLGAALIWTRNVLAAREATNHRYLRVNAPLSMSIPGQEISRPFVSGLPSPTPVSPKKQISSAFEIAASEPLVTAVEKPTSLPIAEPATELPVVIPVPYPGVSEPPVQNLVEAPVVEAPLATVVTRTQALMEQPTSQPPPPTPVPPTEVATELPASNPIVYIEIPALQIKRAVVPVGLRADNSGAMSWDTDAIFATNNRPDLVGHLVGSAYPGQGGNVILIGHNYNQVDYGWEGVFVNIKTLQAGDRILIRGEDGREYSYLVELVKQVPWRTGSANELEKHFKYLGPVKSERLTLVTCGGANIWPFPARVYVVAVPEAR
jgi:hypothetical protein